MKTIKPQKLGVLHRTFENDGKCYFVPTLLLFVPFDAPTVPLHEVNMWKLIGEAFGKEAAFDECMWKLHGEVLVTGKAHPPGGKPQPACAVRVQVGTIDKRLYVVGERQWRRGVATDPEPFTDKPVDWAHAYGGEGFDKNPLGKGYRPVDDGEGGDKVHQLPNVEHPKKLISSPGDKPEPVGFGAIDLTWPQRMSKRGTYDKRWLEERFPGFAEDLDWTFFNVAPPDQWIDGYFQGGEEIVVENMHPDEPRLASRIPELRARCFVTSVDDEDKKLREIPLRIDTVHLFPGSKRAIVIFRGVTEVREDDASDIAELVAACEDPAAPKPLSHYAKVLEQRLDREKGFLFTLRDSDLMPRRDPDDPVFDQESLGDTEEHAKVDSLVAHNMRRRIENEVQAAREKIIELGLDPDDFDLPKEIPPIEEPPNLEDIPEYVEEQLAKAEEVQAAANEQRDEMMADARRHCEEAGLDFDALLEAEQAKQGGPPTFNAAEEIERLQAQVQLGRNAGIPLEEAEAKVRDPELRTKLEGLEATLMMMYRRFAHHFPAAARLKGEEASRLRAEVVRARDAGESLAERDLTGADLSGLDLRGVDLQRAFLERANLTDCDLTGAKLNDTVFARADLTQAKLTGAEVKAANFGEAKLHGTDLSGGVDLSGAVFAKAELVGASLAGATLDGVDFMDSVIRECDLSAVSGSNLIFFRNDLSGARLVGCRLESCNFFEVDLRGADFSGATLSSTAFVTVKGDGARFDQADCTNLRVVADSSLAGASFREAKLDKANLRSTNLRGCDFTSAELAAADLSESSLDEAIFYRANAPKALMMKSSLKGANMVSVNLMEGLLQKANIEGASFKGANLFRVDFAKIKGDDRTNFEDANMKFIRFVKRTDG